MSQFSSILFSNLWLVDLWRRSGLTEVKSPDLRVGVLGIRSFDDDEYLL